MKLSLSALRLRGVWLLVLPFFWFARPRVGLLAAGAVVVAVGLLIRSWAASWIHKNQTLATSGPYAHTRNPLYPGSFLIGMGVTIAGGHPTFIVLFLLFFAIVYGKTMAAEASHLESVFGDQYRRFAQSVPLFLPRLRSYRDEVQPPDANPSVDGKRYLHNREYEALLGAIAAFALLAVKMVWAG